MADPKKRYTIVPARSCFRTNPLFATGVRRYGWMNNIVCVGVGYVIEGGIAYKVSEVV